MKYLLKVSINFLKICVNGIMPGFDLIAGKRRKGYGYFILATQSAMLLVTLYAASVGVSILGNSSRLLLFMFSFVYLCVVSLVGVCLTRRYKYPDLTKSILFSKISLGLVLLFFAGGSVYLINPYVYAVDAIFASSPMPGVDQYYPPADDSAPRARADRKRAYW